MTVRGAAPTGLAVLLGLLTLLSAWGCGGGGDGDATATDSSEPAIGTGEPIFVRPDRSGFTHDLFVVTGSGAGQSFQIRTGPEREPQILGASLPTYYDGAALARFGRIALRRTVDLPGGGTFDETRIRLWEEDGLGAGRWVHEHGLYRDLDDDFGADCDPSQGHCAWREAGGLDVVSIVGSLRGMRRWSGGDTGGDRAWTDARFSMRDRFGDEQEFLRLWGPQHREMIRRAREIWDALPGEERACLTFDYRSSYVRPAPGGLVWVMHGTPQGGECDARLLPIEVPVDPPLQGGIDPSSFGEPGDVYHFGPPDLWFEPGTAPVVRTAAHRLTLPAGDPDDPPVSAIHWMAEAEMPEAHRAAVDLAYTEIHDLSLRGGPAPTVDGDLRDWGGAELLWLDASVNVEWVRGDTRWEGPDDASMAVGVRAAEGGWVVAVRVWDDGWAPAAEGRRDIATDHLQVWLRGEDGWIQLAVYSGDADGTARVVARALAQAREQEVALEGERSARSAAGVHGATRRREEGGRYQGLDAEVFLPTDLARIEDGRVGLRVLFADADGDNDLQGDLRVGTSPALAPAWLHVQEVP